MKKLLKLSSLLLSFSLLGGEIDQFLLSFLLKQKCSLVFHAQERTECQKAVEDSVAFIHQEVISYKHITSILYPEKLKQIASEELTELLLQQLIATKSSPNWNIYTITYDFYQTHGIKNPQNKTIETLSILIQDLTNYWPIEYLQTNKYPEHFLSLYEEFLNMIFLISKSPEKQTQLLFPTHLNSFEFNNYSYYFYGAAYLTHYLKNKGYTDRISAMIPLIFITTYKFSYIHGNIKTFFYDPTNLNSQDPSHMWRLRDVWSGFCGAAYALNKNNLCDNLHFKKIQNNFSLENLLLI